ncbi:hypothetical protein J5N97_020623 [Dioscorea zingiberensis]|uniref:Uncharacterized protein n=1 Tax=Dioscorea zingiberensis TaxID=325984 RepID=A0A9D5HDL3_9LILI|nr:hypothetical protein J5N97_020623 [Dioscorea zingiberensis]
MRFHLGLGSKAKKLFVSSLTKKKSLNGEIQVGNLEPALSFRSTDYGSKEEIFFDSRAWLDSDCEDFYSVNGDFTPSRGSTPNYQFGTPGTTPQNKAPIGSGFPNSNAEPSPTNKKKKLADLLQESLYSEQIDNKQNVKDNVAPNREQYANRLYGEHPPKSAIGTPYFSGASSVCGSEAMTPNRDTKHRKERRSSNCCFPSLGSTLSFSERKTTKMSPEHTRG